MTGRGYDMMIRFSSNTHTLNQGKNVISVKSFVFFYAVFDIDNCFPNVLTVKLMLV